MYNIKNVLFLNFHDAPYRTPTLTALKACSPFEAFDVVTMFARDSGHSYWNLNYGAQADILLLPAENNGRRKWHRSIRSVLANRDYDCYVISGFYHYTSLYLLITAFLKRKPIVFMLDNVETPTWSRARRVIERIRIFALGLISDAFWVPGLASTLYLQNLGNISEACIFHGAYSMDTGAMAEAHQRKRHLKVRYRTDNCLRATDTVFLMAANFLENRMHLCLIRAFAMAQRTRPNLRLILLGEGPTRTAAEELVRKLGLEQSISFPGGVAFEELSTFYSICDVYIHSGAEPYSTALVYAACVGLPLISSTRIGAALDVIQHERNGFLVDTHSAEALSSTIGEMYDLGTSARYRMGKESLLISATYSPEWASMQLLEAINYAGKVN